MPQIPALFLPKKKTEENTQPKNSNKNRKKKESMREYAKRRGCSRYAIQKALLDKRIKLVKGKIDGYKKNNGQIRSGAITG